MEWSRRERSGARCFTHDSRVAIRSSGISLVRFAAVAPPAPPRSAAMLHASASFLFVLAFTHRSCFACVQIEAALGG